MNPEKDRKWLFQRLQDAIVFSEKKYRASTRKDCASLKWCRCMVQAIQAYGKLLSNEEIEIRLEQLEKMVGDGVVIPSEKH